MTERVGFDFGQVLGTADALPMLLCFVDRNERYQFCNRSFAEFFGRPRGAVLGRTVRELLGEEAYAARQPMLAAALAGERQWFAAEYDHPQRGKLALQTEYLPQVDSDSGAVPGVTILIHDVTEQRVAELALRESETRFRRIANSLPALIWVARLDGSFDFINQTYADFFGISAAEPDQFDWNRMTHPDDLPEVRRKLREGTQTGEQFTVVARFRRHDGEWRWLSAVSKPRCGPDGQIIGYLGTSTDITITKLAESELKTLVAERTAELAASENRFRAVFNTALEMICLMTPEGRYLEVNQTACELMGMRPESWAGKLAWETPPVADDPEAAGTMRHMIERAAAGATAEAELTIRCGGQPATHLTSVKPVPGPDGKPIYLVGEARDVSELRGAQEQLRQSQKMEALGQLTGGLAHDFNNLLTVVVGGLDLIVKREQDPKLQRYASNALEAAERGARLTAQLLAFSRTQRLEVQPTLVAPLIEHMRPLLRNVLGPRITKEFELDCDMMPVLADPTQLELAVLNLAINARDAMPDGGTLTFRTRKLAISDHPELESGDYIEFSVVDTGTGMPPDVIERAFEPFFTTKEVGRGTGLGLSMVYGMARQSGGTARIDSEPGRGTRVQLFLRRAPDRAPDDLVREGSAGGVPALAGGSVLVIDDDPDVRGFVVATLNDLGYDVQEAGDGLEGLAEYRNSPPDLVIVDFVMPGLTGADVAREIRAMNPAQKILFVSGYNETDAIKRAAPDAALLAKPFRAEALDDAVRAALHSNH